MKKFAFATAMVLLLTIVCACATQGSGNYEYQKTDLYVRYMTNAGSESVDLSTGRETVGDNLLFYGCKINSGDKLTPPEGQPEKDGFKFVGWATDAEGTALWDFNASVTSSVTLFAKWERNETEKKEEYVEPKLSFVEQKDESTPINIKGVLNMPVSDNSVRLARAAIRLLNENADDVRQLLNYTVDSKTTITSATYAADRITINYDDGSGTEKVKTIGVVDVSASLAVETNYETKAVKYENNVHIAPYSVIMAGSSSMENWTTSVADMAPITTANVGIGGTTVEQWSQKLAKRLIYPYNPRAVILYVGINNIINSKKSGQETGNALITLFNDIHAHLPDAQIYFILINKVPGYTTYYGDIDIANGTVMSYASAKDYMTLIDAGRGLIKQSGKTNSAYFLTDGLHMSLCGYVIWGKAVKDAFIAKEKELYK